MAKKKVTKKTTVTVTEEIVDSNDYTHIICLLDKSGSMGFNNIIKDARGGVNSYIKKQQKKNLGKATISIYLFDDTYEEIYSMTELGEAKELTDDVWYPQGMTRLYDALGKTINSEKANIKKLKKSERPDKVLFVITTDGEENDSREYDGNEVKKMIRNQEEAGWEFIYTAAGQNAFDAGTKIGISGGNTYTFTNSTKGYNDFTVTLDAATTNYRAMASNTANFNTRSANLMSDASTVVNNENDEEDND
jgi:uncharacterized protein YegL